MSLSGASPTGLWLGGLLLTFGGSVSTLTGAYFGYWGVTGGWESPENQGLV